MNSYTMEYKLKNTEVLLFYKLASIYEEKIKSINTDKEFIKIFPRTAEFFKNKFPKGFTKSRKIDEIGTSIPPENTMYMTIYKSHMLSFFRHVRNSYCHYLLEKDNNFYIIIDHDNNHRATARGKISASLLKELIEQLDLEYKEL